ncbi:MAG: EAL domain-containing protein, partial [Proteobacteria bacterium]|nr:EAL domain-containing protein [Pseudomonadota bacterium]
DNGADPELLLQRADVAMYYAKHTRIHIASYHKDMDSDSHSNMIMSRDLRDGINNDQFKAIFQPKVSLSTGGVCGVELLLRWQHPSLGLLKPEQFIPLAERDNLIGELTRWAMRKYLPELVSIVGQFPKLHVSINVSPNDLLDSFLFKEIINIAEETSYPLKNLFIEVTENAIMQNPDRSVDILNNFNNAGIGVSVDDFGTGYSSLAYLQKFPISELKIDKSFIHNLEKGSSNYPIVSATITMAHDLDIKVTAEGVEKAAEARLLKEMGCDYVQGFLFSHPVELEPLEEFIKLNLSNAGAC